MKSFSVFRCTAFPDIKSQSLEDVMRDAHLFGGRDLKTSFRLINDKYHGYILLEVEHSYQQQRPGRAMVLKDGDYKEVKFSEFVEDVTFNAYYDPKEGILIFAVKKEIAEDVYKNIQLRPKLKTAIHIEQIEIDFDVLEPLIGEYKSVWFKGMKSGGLHSASLAGSHLKEHAHFLNYKNSGGKMSYVTIPFVYDDAVHNIGITKDSGVILQQKYENIRIELDIISDIYKKLFKKVWEAQNISKK
jgi:hypothetical protein